MEARKHRNTKHWKKKKEEEEGAVAQNRAQNHDGSTKPQRDHNGTMARWHNGSTEAPWKHKSTYMSTRAVHSHWTMNDNKEKGKREHVKVMAVAMVMVMMILVIT